MDALTTLAIQETIRERLPKVVDEAVLHYRLMNEEAFREAGILDMSWETDFRFYTINNPMGTLPPFK